MLHRYGDLIQIMFDIFFLVCGNLSRGESLHNYPIQLCLNAGIDVSASSKFIEGFFDFHVSSFSPHKTESESATAEMYSYEVRQNLAHGQSKGSQSGFRSFNNLDVVETRQFARLDGCSLLVLVCRKVGWHCDVYLVYINVACSD